MFYDPSILQFQVFRAIAELQLEKTWLGFPAIETMI